MLQQMMRMTGRTVANVTVMLLCIGGLAWAAHVSLGIGPEPAALTEGRLWALAEKGSAALEDILGDYWQEETALNLRTRRMKGLLEREIERLQWIEAESAAQTASMDAELDQLQSALETSRAGLLELAQLMEMNPGSIFVEGRRYQGEEIELYAAEKMAEFTSLQEQVELYQQARATHRTAALEAGALRQEAVRNVQMLEAHQALLKATLIQGRMRETKSSNNPSVQQLSGQLRDQLERNRRIVERRRLLENGINGQNTELPDLDDLVSRGRDLASAMKKLAQDGAGK
ncbi:MAG: hypothetical protein H6642_15215 [Caldilineaceae bacterium]|nr:hypothetical protein [Caldilineaceae bacterium]